MKPPDCVLLAALAIGTGCGTFSEIDGAPEVDGSSLVPPLPDAGLIVADGAKTTEVPDAPPDAASDSDGEAADDFRREAVPPDSDASIDSDAPVDDDDGSSPGACNARLGPIDCDACPDARCCQNDGMCDPGRS